VSPSAGGGGRVRVLRPAAAGDHLQRAQLLRRVRQRGRHDERRRDAHVQLPDPQTSREEAGALSSRAMSHCVILESIVVLGDIPLHVVFNHNTLKPCALCLATLCHRNNMICCRRSSCTLGWDDQGRHPGASKRQPCAERLGARHMPRYGMPSAHAAVSTPRVLRRRSGRILCCPC